jgi:hypothetical protein
MAAVEKGPVPDGFERYLAAELRSITFSGEDKAAKDALRTHLHAVAVDGEVRRLAEGGKQADALRLARGDASRAFADFDDALGKTLAINRTEFDRAVDRGFAALAGYDVARPLAALAVAALAFLGLRPRMREYAAS